MFFLNYMSKQRKSSIKNSAVKAMFFKQNPLSPLMLLHMMLGLKRESFVWRSVVWTVNLTVDFLTNQKFYQSTNIHLLKLSHYLSRLSTLELIQITGESSFFISWKFNFWKIIFFYFSESVNQMNQPPVQMGPSGAAGGGGGGGQGGGQNPSPMAHQDGMYTNPLWLMTHSVWVI